jgi:hypothetical protein
VDEEEFDDECIAWHCEFADKMYGRDLNRFNDPDYIVYSDESDGQDMELYGLNGFDESEVINTDQSGFQ